MMDSKKMMPTVHFFETWLLWYGCRSVLVKTAIMAGKIELLINVERLVAED